MELLQRLTAKGPKRILSLDGGGVRGSVTIGFLMEIEKTLRQLHGKPDLRLCDYFDLIGGTSAGSVLASALALGMEVQELRDLAMALSARIFGRKKWKAWEAFFDAAPLKEILFEVFGDRTISDPGIRTGLCIVTKRADTRSTWPLFNHPGGKYYEMNRNIRLREVIYASTAAPYYFIPEKIHVGDQVGAFVDGGVSMALNPALQLFQLATQEGYAFRWDTGENNLLLLSIGTGTWNVRDAVDKVAEAKAWDWTKEVPTMLMEDASMHNQMILQWISRSPTAWVIDSEIGNLGGDLLTPEPLLHYLRYNAQLDQQGLQALGVDIHPDKIESLRSMSAPENRELLLDIGRASATRQVKAGHFPAAFNV